MAHEWHEYRDPARTPAELFLADPQRRCARCGAVQTRVTETWYMRVARYRWLPLVGRCPMDRYKSLQKSSG